MNERARIITGLLTPKSILNSLSLQTFTAYLPCARHVLGTRNKKINNSQRLTSKEVNSIQKACRDQWKIHNKHLLD